MSVGGISNSSNVPISGATSTPSAPSGPSPLGDAAFAKAFPRGFEGAVAAGAHGDRVVAIQYALGRLGVLHVPVDGGFGPKTQDAVRSFQAAHGLAASGVVDAATLSALDAAVKVLPTKTP